jgi:thiamine monophosphate kinase
MNLKNQYKRLFEGRAAHAKANQLIMNDSLLNEQEEADTASGFDYDYYIEQIEALQSTIEETEYELLQQLDNLAEDEEVYGLVSTAAEQAANQVRRYINGATKQIEGIEKLLDRAKRQKSFDA